MNYQQLKTVNLITIALYVFAISLSGINSNNILLETPRYATALFIVFFLAGANITYLGQQLFRRYLDTWVFITISLLNSLFLVPLFLVLSFLVINKINLSSITFIYILILLIPFIWHSLSRRYPTIFRLYKTTKLSRLIPRRSLILHPITIALVLIAAVHIINTSAFQILPAPDTYSWLLNYNSDIASQTINTSYGYDRILYQALTASATLLPNIGLFVLFKYIYPLLSVLTIIPLWLIARLFNKPLVQLFILLTPLVSPTIILEMEISRQQIIFLIFLFFFSALSIHAAHTNSHRIFLLTGLYSIIGSLYHPLFALTTIAWLIGFALSCRRSLLKLKWLVIIIPALPIIWKYGLHDILNRGYSQLISAFRNFLSGNWNLYFPAAYTNVDTNEVGWSGLSGIIKYYGYYAGPFSLSVIFITVIFLFFNKQFRKFIFTQLKKPYLAPIFIIFIFFFGVAELFPRFSNIAYLPDRAWQYLGISTVLFAFLILRYTKDKIMFHYAVTILLAVTLIINAGGAFYVNNQTKYTIPDYELAAAQWINDNLPADKIILSKRSSRNLIKYHAKSANQHIPSRLFADTTPEKIINMVKNSPPVQKLDMLDKPLYIYYARPHPKNPYLNRPYLKNSLGEKQPNEFPALDNNPDVFTEIYADDNNVRIWQINPKLPPPLNK